MANVGDRVFAVRDANETHVNLYGFGVYDGDHPRPNADELVEEYLDYFRAEDRKAIVLGRSVSRLINRTDDELREEIRKSTLVTNPRITLDNGEVIWGMQCWWAPMDKWEAFLGDREINELQTESVTDGD